MKCGDSLSKRWPVTPPLRVVGVSSKGPSSSLLAIALERCLRLINKACCSTVQATPVLESLTLGKTTTRENDPISSPFVTDTVGPNKPQHKGPQDLDQTLRQEGSLIAQKYVLKSNDGDTQNQLSAWIRALCLAGKDRSVSIPTGQLGHRVICLTSVNRSFPLAWPQWTRSKIS